MSDTDHFSDALQAIQDERLAEEQRRQEVIDVGEAPPLVSDNNRWYTPRWGRDPTTGRALNADGSVNRAGRPPGPYTKNGSTTGRTYGRNGSSHKEKKYTTSGKYQKGAS